jgi:hypothetical protein
MLLALSTQLCPHRCHSFGIQVPFPPTRQVQGRISNKDSAFPCCVLLCGKAFEGFFVLLSPRSRGFGLVTCLQIHRIRSLAEIWCSAQRALMTCCRRTSSSLPKSPSLCCIYRLGLIILGSHDEHPPGGESDASSLSNLENQRIHFPGWMETSCSGACVAWTGLPWRRKKPLCLRARSSRSVSLSHLLAQLDRLLCLRRVPSSPRPRLFLEFPGRMFPAAG